jgi:hypothetical protein
MWDSKMFWCQESIKEWPRIRSSKNSRSNKALKKAGERENRASFSMKELLNLAGL